MAIRWTTERVVAWEGGARVEREVRAAQRWRIRVISDRADARPAGAPVSDFVAILDRDLEIWLRPFSSSEPLERRAADAGSDLEIAEDITPGLRHEISVQVKPSDDEVARWSCTCGVGSRGSTTPELAREAAEMHALEAPDGGVRRADRAVSQGPDGAWAQVDVSVIRRFRLCVRSDHSAVKVHRTGYGEEFELAVDGRLGLWTRRLGADTALRKDESARGVSLLVLELI